MPTGKRDKLLSVLRRLALSLSELLIRFADETEVKLQAIEEARKEGFREGYQKAKDEFGLTYPCPKCGRPVMVTSETSKSLASKYLAAHGPGHAECSKKTAT
jgi:hypothetical protein